MIPAVWISITYCTLQDARPITTAMHSCGVTDTPPRFIASVPAVWDSITHSVPLNARSVSTSVVAHWITWTSQLVRLILAVNSSVAPHTLIQASPIIAAEAEGLIACAVAVEFIRVIRAVKEPVAMLVSVNAAVGGIGAGPLSDVIARQLVWYVRRAEHRTLSLVLVG